MNERQRLLMQLLDEHDASNQLQLRRLLAARGFEVTQATVSRDLDRLGAVRVRRQGRLVYALPEEAARPADPVGAAALALGLVTSMEAAGHLLVLRTAPANAHPVALAFDQAGFAEVAGSVAGDDTLLLIAREPYTGSDLYRLATRLKEDPAR